MILTGLSRRVGFCKTLCYSRNMRQTLSISVSKELNQEIDEIVRSGLYSSKSELIRDAVRNLKEKNIIRELKESQSAAKKGNMTKLSSLGDLR